MNGYIIVGIILVIAAGLLYIRYVNTKDIKFLDYNYDFYFEPENPITTPKDFTAEIAKHFAKEHQFVSILHESMEPTIKINNEIYICRLGVPLRTWKTIKVPISPFAGRFLGYKWVYIYKEKYDAEFKKDK